LDYSTWNELKELRVKVSDLIRMLMRSIVLLSALCSAIAFAQSPLLECGGEWIAAKLQDIGNTPYKVTVIENSAREVSPGYWVSDNPKGGRLYVTFGQPTGSTFITRPPFSIDNALLLHPLLEQWRADNSPYSFRFKILTRWSLRALPAYEPILSWVPKQRDFTAPLQFICGADRKRHLDVNGDRWTDKVYTSKGSDGYEKWRTLWSNRYSNQGLIPDVDVNRWYQIIDSYTVDFDPWICNTHLGAGLEIKEFRELRIDEWTFITYQSADPTAINPCK
jgi:hypothetical protein